MDGRDHPRRGYGGPPKLRAKAEGPHYTILENALEAGHDIVKTPAHDLHLLERASPAGAVGEQHEIAIENRIDPERRSSVADVAEGRG